jgi:hypothetical protein
VNYRGGRRLLPRFSIAIYGPITLRVAAGGDCAYLSTTSLSDLGHGRIIRITSLLTLIEGGRVCVIQRDTLFESLYQIRVGQERSAKGHQISISFSEGRFCAFRVIAPIGDVGACETTLQFSEVE